MSAKDHTNAAEGEAARMRTSDEGRAKLRAGLKAQAAFFRKKGDIKRAAECDAEAETLS